MKKLYYTIVLCLACTSCLIVNIKNDCIIMTYNVMALFDGIDSGHEYSEYSVSNGEWNTELYKKRVSLVVDAIQNSAPSLPDFIILEELENETILEDIKHSFKNNPYVTSIFLPNETRAIGTGILSFYKPIKILSHTITIEPFITRPIPEVHFILNNEHIVIFAPHLKSKTEGPEITENARVLALESINTRILEILNTDKDASIIIAGDLNENINEFEKCEGKYVTALMPLNAKVPHSTITFASLKETQNSSEPGTFFSPWLLKDYEGKGSYFYKDSYETIDHILLSKNLLDTQGLQFSSFHISNYEKLFTSSGKPKKWITKYKEGYSDHLPIFVVLSYSQDYLKCPKS